MNPTDIALKYAERGWPVFPCRAADEADPSTGEVFSAKSPLTANGLNGATRISRVIKEEWKRHPGAMIGIPTGRETRVWVLDVDRKALDDGGTIDGFATLAGLEKTHSKLPETAAVDTPRGGRHYYFRHVDGIRNRGGLGAGIDVRGDGGFVIAAGSRMADGREYKWRGDPETIADAPQWLLDLVIQRQATPYQAQPYRYNAGGNTAYVEAAVEAELSQLAAVGQGGRGEALNRSAFNLGTIVGAGALSRQEAESGLYQAAAANGVLDKDGERETWAKIRRGLDSGERQPRHIPEAEYEQDNTPPMDFSALLGKVKAKPVPVADDEPVADGGPLIATPFNWLDPKDLPRREFVYGTHLIRKYVSATVSPGGVGKTTLLTAESMAMVTGRALLGQRTPTPLRVWLFNAEDPRDEMDRRIMATAMHYNLKPADLQGRLFVDVGREQELVVAIDNKRGIIVQKPIVDAVIAQIQKHKIDVMVLDPFVSTHQVNENDNMAIDRVVKTWAHIADVTNCAIDLVHHIKKVSDREATVEDSRGASALLGAARSVRVLNRMTDDQAAKANVKDQKNSIFYVTRGKANMSPDVGAVEWRRLENVGLGNGRGLMAPQDHVGVAVEWEWPSGESILEELPEGTLMNVSALLDAGSYRANAQAKDWAGLAVARVLGLSTDDEKDKARIKQILKLWKEAGELTEITAKDARGMERPYMKSVEWVGRNGC